MRAEARAFAIALVLVLGAARPAFADADQDAAFKSGLEQYARGNHVAAITTWESLLGTLGEERGYKVLYNLGLAYQAIGDVTRAIERFRAFVKQVGARSDVPRDLADRAADAQTRLEQLERSHGAVNVRAPTRGGLVLTRIGTSEPRAAGYVVWLAPGHHELELFVGTDHVKRVKLDVVAGKSLEVDTSPPEAPPPPPATAAPATPPAVGKETEERSSKWIWIGVGATVVSFALPGALYLVASKEKDDATALGRGHSGYADARASFENWRTAHYVSYALPAAFALATLGYVVLRPSAKVSTKVGVRATGLVLDGTF